MPSRSRSLTAKPVILERYEIDALIEWHQEQQLTAADREEYDDAAAHKQRIEELTRERHPQTDLRQPLDHGCSHHGNTLISERSRSDD